MQTEAKSYISMIEELGPRFSTTLNFTKSQVWAAVITDELSSEDRSFSGTGNSLEEAVSSAIRKMKENPRQ